jgi:Ca2+/H+ antiporter, TMEM165/GDT1 family
VSHSSVFVTTFLAAAVEVIEMVIIVVGVGSVRGWRSTWLGAGGGLAVVTWLLHTAAVAAWWLPPLAAVAVVGVSLRRAGW